MSKDKEKEEENVSPVPGARLLPWHTDAVAQLRTAWQAQRLPHSLLLTGPAGLGRRALAAWIASAVLCEKSGEAFEPCGRCASCDLLHARSHPDFVWVAPVEEKMQISIEQIRDITDQLTKTSYRHGFKVAVIEPAHLMTVNAANSLLKTLEEPTPRTLLVLITAQPSVLPPTVRSRCQMIAVGTPSAAEAMSWLEQEMGKPVDRATLEFAGGAPLRALEWSGGRFASLDQEMQTSLTALMTGRDDVTQVASRWAKDALADRLTWLDRWLMSAARAAIAQNADLFTFPSARAHLPTLPQTLT